MTQLARPDPARNRSDSITYALAVLRPPLTYCQPIARDFSAPASKSLAGRWARPCWRPLS